MGFYCRVNSIKVAVENVFNKMCFFQKLFYYGLYLADIYIYIKIQQNVINVISRHRRNLVLGTFLLFNVYYFRNCVIFVLFGPRTVFIQSYIPLYIYILAVENFVQFLYTNNIRGTSFKFNYFNNSLSMCACERKYFKIFTA